MKGYDQIGASPIADGVLRIGGYGRKLIKNQPLCFLLTLVFRIEEEVKEQTFFAIINTVDDIEGADVRIGQLTTSENDGLRSPSNSGFGKTS